MGPITSAAAAHTTATTGTTTTTTTNASPSESSNESTSSSQSNYGIAGPPKLSAVELLVAGGMAGAVAKSFTAPLDRIKILYQVNPERPFTYLRAVKSFKTIFRHSGIQGLWRGNGATLIRVIPYASISFMSFDRYQRLLQQHVSARADPGTRFLAGAAAGATATTLTYPLDLCRARMAAHWGTKPLYGSYVGAFRDIVRLEGLGALWKGLTPTLMGIIPYAGVAFSTMETLKATYISRYNNESMMEIPSFVRLLFGGFSGIVAQSLTYPLDTVRRRLQVSTPNNSRSLGYTGAWNAMQTIVRHEGFRGLYKGLSMNWIKGPIATAVSFYVNDHLRYSIAAYHNKQRSPAASTSY